MVHLFAVRFTPSGISPGEGCRYAFNSPASCRIEALFPLSQTYQNKRPSMQDLDWQSAEQTAQGVVNAWGLAEPGGVIVAFHAEGTAFSCAGGLENLNTASPFTSRSVGRFASITKHFLCSLVVKHPEIVGLDDRLGDHLPELAAPIADVTVRLALDMTGGLPDMRECLTLLGLSVHTETSAADNHDFMARQTRLNFEAGTEISYSNTGYRLVEILLERKGLYLQDYLINEINLTLGTAFAAPHVWETPVRDLIPGYWNKDGTWLEASAGLQISASGSIAASADSMVVWLRALMAGKGAWSGVLDTLATPHALNDGTPTGYGLGLCETHIGDRVLIGHGGGHPGFKSYILMDRESGTGVVVLSNRDEVDSRGAAVATMTALLGAVAPKTSVVRLPDGLYVTDTGPFWLEVSGATATWMDDAGTLYEEGQSKVSSRSTTSPMLLEWDGAAIRGQIGLKSRVLKPADKAEGLPTHLDGLWQADENAFLAIREGKVIMGAGPTRQVMPLSPLGGGRYLFTYQDSLWTKRICLNQLGPDRIELALSRARMIEYKCIK